MTKFQIISTLMTAANGVKISQDSTQTDINQLQRQVDALQQTVKEQAGIAEDRNSKTNAAFEHIMRDMHSTDAKFGSRVLDIFKMFHNDAITDEVVKIQVKHDEHMEEEKRKMEMEIEMLDPRGMINEEIEEENREKNMGGKMPFAGEEKMLDPSMESEMGDHMILGGEFCGNSQDNMRGFCCEGQQKYCGCPSVTVDGWTVAQCPKVASQHL